MSNVSVINELKTVVVASEERVFVVAENERVTVVDVGAQGPAGAQGPSATAIFFLAASAVSGNRMMLVGADRMVSYASNDDLSHANRVIGMTVGAASALAQVELLREMEIQEPGWTWAVGGAIYLGVDGLITQTPPTAPALFSLCVGFATAPDRMFVTVGTPIIFS